MTSNEPAGPALTDPDRLARWIGEVEGNLRLAYGAGIQIHVEDLAAGNLGVRRESILGSGVRRTRQYVRLSSGEPAQPMVQVMKQNLHEYLQTARDSVVWKLEGLSEYDVRRPTVPSGTNLLGLVKHLTCVELGYFGPVFGRPMGQPNLWFEDDEDNVDLFARADESRQDLVADYRRACATADSTIEALDLDSPGSVPWWGNQPVTLGRILVHVTTETCRHAGHADLVRELIDGEVGYATGNSNVPEHDAAWWRAYRDRVEQEARRAAD